MLSLVGLQHLTLGMDVSVLQEWWSIAENQVPKVQKKGFNSLVILVAWYLWKHRNSCIFYGASPNCSIIQQNIREDAILWGMSGVELLEECGLRLLRCLLVDLWVVCGAAGGGL